MISVIIPSYNRRECMLKLLADLFSQRDVEFEVIVVDDCSSDDSVEKIKKEYPSVRLYENDTNGGPCVSRNKGINVAKYQIIVGIDSDVTIPDEYCLLKVIKEFKNFPEIDGLSFRLKQPNEIDEDFARWWHPHPIKKAVETRFLTPYFSGTAYAFRKQSIVDAGLFPEILYMSYEENELALQFLNNGHSLMYTPIPWVVHHEDQVARRSEVREYYRHRNQILMAIKCFPLFMCIRFIVPRTIYAFFDSLRNRSIVSYFKSLVSACKLSMVRLKTRNPLKKETWDRINKMKASIVPPQSPDY